MENWVPPRENSDFCIYASATNDRFLDLTAVGYSYNPKTATISERPDALSRFMLFSQFEVLADDEATLARLKEPDFAPLRSVILKESPGFESRRSDSNATKLQLTEADPDHIEVHIHAEATSILLFDDSFDIGWRATVNGAPGKIIEADYNFMAIPVPAGNSKIVLEYRPRAFQIGAICAAIGLASLALAFAILIVHRAWAVRVRMSI
jgi:hypothetical protein